MLRAIIFDFNGVIIDDEPLHLELIRRVLAEEGMTITDQDYRDKYLGFDDRGCFVTVLKDTGRGQLATDTAFIDELIRRKATYYQRAIDERYLLFPGAVELVQRLAAQFPLAIASGALRQEIELVLARGGIRDCFQAIIAAEDVSECKPHPEGYIKALASLNLDAAHQMPIQPSECLVIEDSIAGIEAARRAGMRCLAITNSYSAGELAQADWIVMSLAECDPAALFTSLSPLTS
jgi:HAD superfamily hydrolase (TIGR01509 family)